MGQKQTKLYGGIVPPSGQFRKGASVWGANDLQRGGPVAHEETPGGQPALPREEQSSLGGIVIILDRTDLEQSLPVLAA